jgi:chemotaxis protein CheY-P-specific phosphatase CheC
MMDIHNLFYKEGYTHTHTHTHTHIHTHIYMSIYKVQKNSMPKIHKVIGETERKIYY